MLFAGSAFTDYGTNNEIMRYGLTDDCGAKINNEECQRQHAAGVCMWTTACQLSHGLAAGLLITCCCSSLLPVSPASIPSNSQHFLPLPLSLYLCLSLSRGAYKVALFLTCKWLSLTEDITVCVCVRWERLRLLLTAASCTSCADLSPNSISVPCAWLAARLNDGDVLSDARRPAWSGARPARDRRCY